jgi:hypothetical protein
MSVRVRLDQQRRANETDEPVQPARRHSVGGTMGNVPSTSVRDRQRRAESEAQGEEVIVRLPKNQSSVCASPGFNVSVRDAQRLRDFRAEEAAAPKAVSSLDAHLAAHQREEAEKARQEAADIASGRLTIIDDGYEERRIRAEYAEKAKQKADAAAAQEAARIDFAITATMRDASPAEAKMVREVIARKYPADVNNPERHWMVLQTIRLELGS